MARLGNFSWKMSKRVDIPEAAHETEGVFYREIHYALREDGVLLEKRIVGFPNLFDDNKERRHDYGWKVKSRKPRADVKQYPSERGYV